MNPPPPPEKPEPPLEPTVGVETAESSVAPSPWKTPDSEFDPVAANIVWSDDVPPPCTRRQRHRGTPIDQLGEHGHPVIDAAERDGVREVAGEDVLGLLERDLVRLRGLQVQLEAEVCDSMALPVAVLAGSHTSRRRA